LANFGLFGSLYRAADRFLPFDGALDPLFYPREAAPVGAPPQAVAAADVARPAAGFMPRIPGAPGVPGPSAPQPQARKRTPAPASTRQGGVNGWRVFDRVLGGETVSEALDAERARPAQAEAMAWWQDTLSKMDPEERAIAMKNPGEWAKAKASSKWFEPKVVAGGSSVTNNGVDFHTAPRVDHFDDRAGVTTIGPDGKPTTAYTAPRGPTFKEESEDRARQRETVSPGQDVVDFGQTAGGYGVPTMEDLDWAIRMVALEEADPQGQQAVAEVIRNRAAAGKKSIRDVITEPGQFEPWSSRRDAFEKMDPKSPEYQRAARAVFAAFGGSDLAGGATHFYAPEAQQALGRNKPAWDDGSGRMIGKSLFFRQPYGEGRVVASKPKEQAQWVRVGPDDPTYTPDAVVYRNSLTGEEKVKTMPAGVQKQEDEDVTAVTSARSINATLNQAIGQIDTGALNLGPLTNTVSVARNMMGASDQNSRNFASFKSNLEKLRNDSLRLNSGVQTEGDAQRAWNELFANLNDEKMVRQRLAEIKVLNDRAVQARAAQINLRRRRNGMPEMNLEDLGVAPQRPSRPAPPRKAVTVQTPAGVATVRPKG
jgi:hypothetical protein